MNDRSGEPSHTTRFAPDDRPHAVDDVEVAVFEGEAVLFHEDAKMVHHLSAVPGAVWFCCDGDTTVSSMIEELAELFGATDGTHDELATAVHEALGRFADEGLLRGAPAPLRIPLTPDPTRAADGTEVLTADDP